MSNWQEKIGDAIRGMTDRQEALVSGAQRGATLTGDTLEKLAGIHLGVAADGVDAAVAQVKLLGQPGNPLTYLQRQVEFASSGFQTAKGRAGELGEVISECTADVASLFEVTPKKAAARNRKAA